MASAETKADCEALMSALLPLAEQKLSEQRVLAPFGSTLTASDQVTEYEGGREPDPLLTEARISALQARFRELAAGGAIKASALAYSSTAAAPGALDPEHAVVIHLDHRDDYSLVVTFPYRWSGSELHIDEPFAAEGAHRIFGAESV